MAINIINLYHYSKKPRPPNVVYCGRSNEYNPLGNPYPMKGKDDRDEVCDQYEDLINFKCPPDTREAIHGLRDRYARTGELNLMCFCAPKRCHCRTIREAVIDPSIMDGSAVVLSTRSNITISTEDEE